jgi:hypothetical protein
VWRLEGGDGDDGRRPEQRQALAGPNHHPPRPLAPIRRRTRRRRIGKKLAKTLGRRRLAACGECVGELGFAIVGEASWCGVVLLGCVCVIGFGVGTRGISCEGGLGWGRGGNW